MLMLFIIYFKIKSFFKIRRTLLNDELSVSWSLASTIENQLIAFNWPDQIFYFLNEELANLNRNLVNLFSNQQNHANELVDELEPFNKLLDIIKVCVIFSK